jgi:hypothetical protein
MPLEPQIPRNWFVRTEADEYGHIKVTVLRATEVVAMPYSSKTVRHAPSWMFWLKPFEERVNVEVRKAKQRAYQLNQAAALSKQVVYRLENPNG